VLVPRCPRAPSRAHLIAINQRGEAYVELFVVILQNVNKEETVQYVLALLDDILVGGSRERPRALRRSAGSAIIPWRAACS